MAGVVAGVLRRGDRRRRRRGGGRERLPLGPSLERTVAAAARVERVGFADGGGGGGDRKVGGVEAARLHGGGARPGRLIAKVELQLAPVLDRRPGTLKGVQRRRRRRQQVVEQTGRRRRLFVLNRQADVVYVRRVAATGAVALGPSGSGARLVPGAGGAGATLGRGVESAARPVTHGVEASVERRARRRVSRGLRGDGCAVARLGRDDGRRARLAVVAHRLPRLRRRRRRRGRRWRRRNGGDELDEGAGAVPQSRRPLLDLVAPVVPRLPRREARVEGPLAGADLHAASPRRVLGWFLGWFRGEGQVPQ